MEVFLLRGRSEKEMDGLDRSQGFQIVRTEPNICWAGGWIFTRGCESESGKQEVIVRQNRK